MSPADRARFVRAIAGFDAANAEDPNRETVDGRERPKELLYAERLTAMLQRFAPDASEVLRLAARAQHIQRWKIPRNEYPMDRIGYLQWRKRLYKFHAQLASEILRDVGYDDATIAGVATLLKKEGLKSNADVQALEDVVDLVFLESYLADFVTKHGEYDVAKFTDILAKTAKKMSPRGRDAAISLIQAPEALGPLIEQVMRAQNATTSGPPSSEMPSVS
jgi:hypothetical protein